MSRSFLFGLALLTALTPAVDTSAQEKPAADSAQAPTAPATMSPEEMQKAREAFRLQLSGSTLVGNFTVDDDTTDKPLKADRYEIAAINPVRDDYWLFVYVHKGVPIPLQLKVLWAGKTPVLTLDDFTIAGMGTFSARVMFHGDRYAGTWQHGQKGGLMFGRIEKPNKEAKPAGGAVPTRPADAKAESDKKAEPDKK